MDRSTESNSLSRRAIPALIGIAVIAGLYASSLYSYLLFHSLVELFSIVTSFVIFVIAWHTRRIQDNRYLLLIGIASLSASAVELFHMLAYKGMGVFPGHSADLATQLWIAFRYVLSLSFLLAAWYIRRSFSAWKMLAVYGIVTAALLFAVFSGRFPACFVEGSGLTPFKINSEYVISIVFLASLGLLIANRRAFDGSVFSRMSIAIVLSIFSELAFTTYVSVFGLANMIGHFLLLGSMAFIYRAIVITGIVDPSNLLFRDLKKSEEAIRESEERYRALVELSPDPISVHSNGIWRYVSRAGLALFGASSPREIVGTPVLDRIHPDDRAVVADRIRQVETVHGPTGLREIRMVRMDGTVLDVESTAVRVSYRGSPAVQVIMRDVTERKRTEHALEKVRAELTAMIEKVPLVALLVDRESRVRKANGAAAAFVGSSEPDMAGFRAGEAIHCIHSLDDPKGCGSGPSCPACPVRTAVVDVFERGTHLQGREAGLSVLRDGRQDDRTVLLTTTPVTIEDEQLALVCIEDITERKRAEDSLRRSLRRFELLTRTAGELLQTSDPQGVVEDLCGRVMEHLDCHAFFNYLVDEKAGRLHLNACAGIPGEERRRIEWLDFGSAVCGCVARDGSRIVAERIPETIDERTDLVRSYGIKAYACHPILGPSGKVIGTLSFGTRSRETFGEDDLSLMKAVTDQVAVAMTRMRDTQALAVGEERLRLFIEHAPAALAMFDREMRYVSASRRWMSDYGLGDRKLAGLSHYEAFPEISEQWKAFHRRGLAGEVVKCDDDRFERADRTAQRLHWEIHPWHDAEGAVAGIVIFTEDITDRKKAEEDIRDLNSELRDHVRQLEAANRELESFSYAVSHDLRAPLRSIDGFSHAILEEYSDRLDGTGRDYFDRVRASATKMGQLIDALLHLSRLTRGELNRTTVDLTALARTAADELRKQEPHRAVEFVIPDGIIVNGDPVMLRVVVENLLANAWKFTARRSMALIELGFESKNDAREYFVRDNGAGFEMDYAGKLFTAFQRLHSGNEFPGIGIGLATVQRIIHRHGGGIRAEGEVGKGATFYFTV